MADAARRSAGGIPYQDKPALILFGAIFLAKFVKQSRGGGVMRALDRMPDPYPAYRRRMPGYEATAALVTLYGFLARYPASSRSMLLRAEREHPEGSTCLA